VARAARLLGRFHGFSGEVVHGDGRGAGLGFPTANQRKPEVVLPVEGVYATRATLEGHAWPAVTCVGRKPTFGDNELGVETFLLEDGKNLYGQMMRLEFVGRVRGEERFASVDALKQRIAQDVKDAVPCLHRLHFRRAGGGWRNHDLRRHS
jgi:FAD synthase